MTQDPDLDRQMFGWFGTPWNGCLTDDGSVDEGMRIPVPVGQCCTWCDDVFVSGDSGKAVPFLHPPANNDSDGNTAPVVGYIHRECLLRSVVGGLDHLAGRCACHSPTDTLGSLSAGMSRHQEAIAVDEHIFLHGI